LFDDAPRESDKKDPTDKEIVVTVEREFLKGRIWRQIGKSKNGKNLNRRLMKIGAIPGINLRMIGPGEDKDIIYNLISLKYFPRV
jgi:hypothetical protein